jgi:D-lactate dehydrogenase
MKDNVMLINTSRGALINTADADRRLKNGKLGYLGIDVYEQEEKLFLKISQKKFKTMIFSV